MEDEIWRDVRGYEGLYKISNLGRVKSLVDNHGKFREKILKPHKDRYGYLFVYLFKGGERKGYKVHRLVLITFAPNPDMENLEVNHLDEDKTNNRLENLEWCDRSYNNNYGTRNARASEKMTNGKTSIPIVQLTLDGKYVRSYKSSHDAERNGGYNNSNIIQCCKNKYLREDNNIYKGYRFMYLKDWLKEHNKGIPKKLYFID